MSAGSILITSKFSLMKTLNCLLLIFLSAQALLGQSYHATVSMPSSGISAYGSTPADFSFQSNVASLAHYESGEVSLFSERRFFMSELQFFSATAALKFGSGRAGTILDHHSFGSYRSSGLSFAYAQKLGRLSLGLKFNYHSEQAAGERGRSLLSAHTGMLFSVTPRLNFGWQVENFPATVSKKSGLILRTYRGGLGFMASKDCLIGLEIIKHQEGLLNFHAGFSYTYKGKFFLRGGTQSASGSYYAGAGWCRNKLRLNLSVSNHPHLGISPGVLLNHKF